MANPTNGANLLNGIRGIASENYRNNVPVANVNNLSEVGLPILTYQAVGNEFLNLLVNKIALPIMRARSYRSPLALLKREGNPLTTDEEEMAVNPAVAKQYDAKSADLLAQTVPDVKVAYHRMNRRERYDCTIQYATLRGGFTSWNGFDRMVEEIVQSLYNGNYIDEFNYTKSLLGSGVLDGTMATIEIDKPINEATGKAFVKAARTAFKDFGFPNTKYNAWQRAGGSGDAYTSWSDAGNIMLFIRNDVESEVDVDVLAAAFHIDRTDLMGRVVVVDNFGEGCENVYAVMCDRAYPNVIDKLFTVEDFRNGSNLSTNYYLHVWQTYFTSPLMQAVAFIDKSVVAAPTAKAENGNKTLFGHKVSTMQSGINVIGNAASGNTKITGTLKYIEDFAQSGPLAGSGNFMALKFDAVDWSEYSDVKVGLDPSEGSGLVSIIDDPDKNGVFKITDKNTQKFVIEYTPVGGSAITVTYDLSELVCLEG